MPDVPLNSAVGNSEKHLISSAILLLRMMLCLALTGCSQSDDPTVPVEFEFPLEAGTTWRYTYYYYESRLAAHNQINGIQVWQSTGTGTGSSIRINLTRTDTARWWYSSTGVVDTTTHVVMTDTLFFVVAAPDSFDVQWYQLSHSAWPDTWGIFRIPRYIAQGTTTVRNSLDLGSQQYTAIFATDTGLTSYYFNNSSNYWIEERLTLQSISQ